MGKKQGGYRLQPRQLHVFPRSFGRHHRLGVGDQAVTMARLALSPVPADWLVVLLLLLPGTAPLEACWFHSVILFPPALSLALPNLLLSLTCCLWSPSDCPGAWVCALCQPC